jgi:hypothetical protein
MTTDELMAALTAATEGLTYPSETDAAVVPVRFAPGEVLPWEGVGGVEEVEVDGFFAALRDVDDAARFHALHQLLWGSVSGLRVYRIGEVDVAIYVVGELCGETVGIRTRSVET